MSRLLLVRHGSTRLDNPRKFWGKTDLELSADGIKQAERLQNRLAAQKINAVYASNLSRAQLTARIIISRHRREVTNCAAPDARKLEWVGVLAVPGLSLLDQDGLGLARILPLPPQPHA